MNACITRSLLPGILALTVSAGAFSTQPDELFQTHVYSDAVLIEPGADQAFEFDVDLIVSGPKGFYHRESFPAGAVVDFDPSRLTGDSLPDGVYHYELRIMGTGLDRVRGNNEVFHLPDAVAADLDPHSGTFAIVDGSFVSPGLDEPVAQLESSGKDSGSFSLQTDDADGGGSRDQVIADDLIVQGSECVGFDCTNGETFGFDTIRMKENNTRLQFTDTSSSSSFPNNNWQIRANDSVNGGANYLGILDQGTSGSSETGTRVLTVSAGAPAHSLFVADTGRVGFRTSTPVLDLHANTGNTPGIRLEQNSSSGFSAQTWDMAGNEANFFIRDVTGGSKLPFRIRPGAPTSSIDISASGNVGMGTASPSASLHVQRGDGTASILLEEAQAVATNIMFEMRNNGNPGFALENSDSGVEWEFRLGGSGSSEQFLINKSGVSGAEFSLTANGDARIKGTLFTGGPDCASGCDRVFESDYPLESIEEHAAKMWSNKFLPAVGPTKPKEPWNMTDKLGGVLNELEKAHIYIEQLHERVKDQSQLIAEMQTRERHVMERLATMQARITDIASQQEEKGLLVDLYAGD